VPFFLTVVCTLLASLPVKADCIIPVEQTRDVSSWGNIISIGHGGDGQELYDAAPDFGPFYIFQPMALIYEMASIDSNAWQHSTTGDNLLVVKCGSVGGTSAGPDDMVDILLRSDYDFLFQVTSSTNVRLRGTLSAGIEGPYTSAGSSVLLENVSTGFDIVRHHSSTVSSFDDTVTLLAGTTYRLWVWASGGINTLPGVTGSFFSEIDVILGVCTDGFFEVSLSCVPNSGTLPFNSQFLVTIDNYGLARPVSRVAARIDVALASGATYSNWRAGYTNIANWSSFTTSWNQSFPALGSVDGFNTFTLVAEDVTPAPYNQPPNPPAGDTATATCTVTGIVP